MRITTVLMALTVLAQSLCVNADSGAGEQVQPTGANIPEDRLTATVHVNLGHPQASDENPGTENAPLRSISRAVQIAVANNLKGVGTRVLVSPGTYREAAPLPKPTKDSTDAPMVFEATRKGAVVLSGSDVFTDWQRAHGEENIYWHHWPYKWGPREQVKDPVWVNCGIFFKPILLRRETVYVNGELLKLVLSPLELREGTCYVSEEEEKLIVWLPKGLDARTALMEVPVRERLFGGQAQKNVAVRGLVFKHDNSYYELGAAFSFSGASRNILVEDCRFENNNSAGYSFNTVRDLTVRRVASNHNGGSGVLGCRLRNVVFEDTENSYNNWRGDWGEYYGWSVGGTKFLQVRNGLWVRNRSIGNHALGFWFDYDCSDIVMDRCWWVGNDRAGIFIEANQGPITIRNSVLALNEYGVMSTNSSRITLQGNAICGNTTAQVSLLGQRDRPVKTWDWGGQSADIVLRIENWTLRDNVVLATAEPQVCLNLSYADPDLLMSSLSSDGNIWYRPGADRAFSVAGVKMTLDEWQSVSGQDANSVFADPGFGDVRGLNFWPGAGSPVRSPAATASQAEPGPDREGRSAILRQKQEAMIRENNARPFPQAKGTPTEQWLAVDLSGPANRPMRGPEGWMGVGGLTLDWLNGGEHEFQGVPFEVLDPIDGKPACIALRSAKVKTTAGEELPSSVRIPVGRKLSALYFLHGCGWAKHAKTGQYGIAYADGTEQLIDIVPYGSGSEHADVAERMRKTATVQDWWPACHQIENDRLRHVIVADPANQSDQRYLYNLQWINPTPNKPVAHIDLQSEAGGAASLFVVAITAALTR